jgi:hypothetical protein
VSAHVVLLCRACKARLADAEAEGLHPVAVPAGSLVIPLDEGMGPFYMRCSRCDAVHSACVRDTSKSTDRWPGGTVLAGGYEVLLRLEPEGKPDGASWRG